MIKAILIDLDGVLMETERETFNFYKKYLKEIHNIELKDSDFKLKAGRKSKDFFNDVLTAKEKKQVNAEELIDLKRELFNKHIDKFVRNI